jgi:signal transduction histidine kinase
MSGWRLRHLSLPLLVFLLGLLSTLAATYQFERASAARDHARFERFSADKVRAIEERLSAYYNLLRGAAGLLAAKPDTSRADWALYVERTRIQELYPGAQGVGYALRISADDRDRVTLAMRAQGFEDFAVRPEGERPETTAIIYLEPLDRRNRVAIGFDMFSEPIRREAMERARDTGLRAMTGKVQLVQEIDREKQPGFLIYVPVYAGGAVPDTVEERRRRLIGWTYSPFRVDDLFNKMFPVESQPELTFSVHDGAVSAGNLLYTSTPLASGESVGQAPRYEVSRPLVTGGRRWTILLASTADFDRDSNRRWTPLVLAAGLLVTLLLTLATSAQARATAAAERSREELRGLNETLESRVETRTTELAKARNELQRVNEGLEAMVAERTADLEAANEEIQRFAYIVSHDLRAPLVNIMGFTSELESARNDMLRAGAKPEDDPERLRIERDFDESLSFVRAATTKMDGLIGAILKISRDGRRAFRPEPLDMEVLFNTLVAAIRHQTDAAGATIQVGKLPGLFADRLAIEQIFANLLDNAVKYLDPSRPGRIEISGEERGARLVYRVSDNGRGIAKADHARVFELFRRAGVQDKPGEGIGLAHVKALVRSLGGHIELQSEPGQGTTFTISLPNAAARQAA